MNNFTRQLGYESGVQLNPLQDNSEIPSQDISDQAFAIAARLTRGRIDKPFRVNRGNVMRMIGKGEPIRTSLLNEAWVHVVEALNNGAYEAVVHRMVTSAAENRFIVATASATTAGSPPVTTPNGLYAWTTEVALPVDDFLFAIKHNECFNDGIKVKFHADDVLPDPLVESVYGPNDRVILQIFDSSDVLLYDFYGSLNPTAVDDFGNSLYLPDVVSARTDSIELFTGLETSIPTNSVAYGFSSTTGLPKYAQSPLMLYFTEGDSAYTTQDYDLARNRLHLTPFDYSYISTGGSQSISFVSKMIQLAYDRNKQLRMDLAGDFTPPEAIAFVKQFNLAGNINASHLVHAFWCPLKTLDPTGLNGKEYFGVATLNIAYACGRNAIRNSKGFAPKNFTIAGRAWPLNRQGVTQTYDPSDQELSDLARAKINPVIFSSFTGGGRYVFIDSLTSAQVDSSLKKLISVADMSTSIDDAVTKFGKDILQLPMRVALRRMNDFLKDLFEDAQASGWLVPSNDPSMGGKSFRYQVKANEVRPYDVMDVNYWLRYDGTVRQIFVTQTLSK